MTATRRLLAGYAILMAAATALYFAWPWGSAITVMIIGLGAVTGIFAGVRRYRPRRTRSWLLLAGAVAVNAVAHVVYELLPGAPGTVEPGAWLVWVLHLVMLVLLIAGVLGLARPTLRGIAGAIDGAVIILGAGGAAVILLAVPYAGAPGIGRVWASLRIAYVLGDGLILAAGLLVVTAASRRRSVLLVCAGMTGLLVYDVLYRIGVSHGVYLSGSAIDLGWLLFFVLIGAAALIPSMAATDVPRPAGVPEVEPLRLVPVAIAASLPSVVLLSAAFRLPRWYDPVLVTVATVVLVLIFARVVDMAFRLRRQITGERILRDAIGDLAAAGDQTTVQAALDRAVSRLLAPRAEYRLVLSARELKLPADLASAPARPYATASLPPEMTARLGGAGHTMVLSLNRGRDPGPDRPVPQPRVDDSDPTAGRGWPRLLVASDLGSLNRIRPRLEVLATEAALALERIALHEQVIRNANEAYFRTLVQNSFDVILIVDDDNRIRYASPSANLVLGPGPLPGRELPGLVDSTQRGAAERLLQQARAGPPGDIGFGSADAMRADWTVHSVGGRTARVEVSCRNLRDDPAVGGLVVTLRDVTQQRQLEHELTRRAFYDPLTGLGNRVSFSDRLDAVVRLPADATGLVAALFVDLDDLKVVNDGLGHDVGDILLARMGDRLRAFVAENEGRQRGMAARLGGDEFAVLLLGVADKDAANEAAGRLVAALSQPVDIHGHEVTSTASVGVATTGDDVSSAAELLRHADLALYAAKAAGKGQWSHYEPWMRSVVIKRLELRSALEHAIADGALFLEYQPIIELESERTVGFEALLRWNHPTRGRLAPNEFIDVAEESGLIAPIGEWVLSTATEAVQRWSRAAPEDPPYIAVNVSARQFRTAGFVATVRRVLAESGLPPQRLLFEITESLLLRDDEKTWQDLQELRQMGVRVAIDDFGTGYSALSYLRQVPLDVVKLDRLFIKTMTTSTRQRRLVEGITGMADVLGLQVVAEGIENDTELDLVKRAGCTYGQGYLFGAPMPDHAVRAWLARRRVLA